MRSWSRTAALLLLLTIAPEAHSQFLAPTKATVHGFVEDETGLPRYGINGAILVDRQQGQPDIGYTARFVRNSYIFIVIRFADSGSLSTSPPPQLRADGRRVETTLHEQTSQRADDDGTLEQSVLSVSNTAYYHLAHADTVSIRLGTRRVLLTWSDRVPLRRLYEVVEDD